MGNIKWNESQRAAIDFRGKNLLLSAAAGSGKTATLTQRIIELLCDPDSEAEISSMLVLTFTNDAAAELKSRISAAIADAISKDPGNKRLVRQLRDLDGAAISTTHSFLINELKPYFMRFDLPPDFSVCDEASVDQLRQELMADTVNDFFEGVCPCSDFTLLADALSGAKDDEALDTTLLSLWKDLMRLGLDPVFLKKESESGDFLTCGIGQVVAEEMRMISRHYEKLFLYYAGELAQDEATAKNAEVAIKNAETAARLGEVSYEGYLCAKVFLSDTKLASSKSVKKELATREYEQYSEVKKKFTDKLKSLYNKYFKLSLDELAEANDKNRRIASAVADVLTEYEKRFSEAKRERGKIDFNDAERFAFKLFCNEDGAPTAEALEVAKKYTHIFIDEYQDTNRLQDMLYTVFSHYGSRFMVGDVKQSVYRFRGARPENFVKYRREYEGGGDGKAIFMSENHRSDSGVIDFSNLVSDYMFPYSETPFEWEDRLVCSKSNGESGESCKVVLVEEGELSEADYVARKIKSMIGHSRLRSGEVVRPKDIAIIMRTGKLSAVYKKKLEENSIPVKNNASENFFDHSEVLLLLSILCTIDNPTSDIYLAASMKSPVFGFTLDDMVRFRGKDKLPLWYSVCRYAQENSDGLALRLRAFVKRINNYRETAGNMLCDKFLYYLITDTGFNALTDDSGSGRLRRSVKKMYSLAVKCAEGGGGLHDLIVYLKGLMNGKESLDMTPESDAVTIITTHSSKGLEYPICFLCDVAKQFNKEDTKKNAIIDPEYGLFMKLPDPEGIVRCDTPYRNAAVLAEANALREEEMRVLYVALTRAREQLIVTLKTRDAGKSLEASAKRVAMGHEEYAVKTVDSAGLWILDAVMLKGSDPSFEFESVRADEITDNTENENMISLSDELIHSYEEQFRERFAFTYQKYHLSTVPAKLPVSKLTPNVLDTGYTSSTEIPPMPAFMAGERKVSAAQRGTATHMLLQFCDFSALALGAEVEAERLCQLGYISRETKDMIRLEEVDAFAKSQLCKSIISAKEVYREVRFNHMLEAYRFTEDETLREKLKKDATKICVQGVVDCLFVDSKGKITLVDYKTDRLTKEEAENKDLAAKKLIERHGDQLYTYKKMCAEMLGRDVDRLLIYSLALGDTIELT